MFSIIYQIIVQFCIFRVCLVEELVKCNGMIIPRSEKLGVSRGINSMRVSYHHQTDSRNEGKKICGKELSIGVIKWGCVLRLEGTKWTLWT